MKKIMTMLMLALVFVGLTPLAFAQIQSREMVYADGNATPTPVLTSARQANATADAEPMLISARQGDAAADTVSDAEPVLVRERARLREIASEKLETARQRYAEAKQKYATAKQRYMDAKQNIEQKKARFNECEGNSTAECVQVRKEVKANTKALLSNAAGRIISMLEKLKEKIAMSEDFSEDDAAEKIAEIESQIDAINDAQEAVDGLTNESSAEEIRDAVSQLREAWADAKDALKLNAGVVVNKKIGGIVLKSQKLSERLELALQKLSEEGYDTSEIEEDVAEFNSKIESAREHHNEAMEKYRQARSTRQNVSAFMQESNTHMRAAQKDLQEAHAILVRVLRQIKSAQGGADALEEAEQELEEDSSA